MSLVEHIAAFALDMRLEDTPAHAADLAKLHILDSVGTAVAGATGPLAAPILLYTTGQSRLGPCTIIGSQAGATAYWAAFANGVSMHADDFDDSPHSSYFLPALLAAGEEKDVSGRALMEAWIVGLEIWHALSQGLSVDRPFNPASVVGPLAAAAGTARIKGLALAETAMAISIAGSASAGLVRQFGTSAKPIEAGRSAQAGLLSAELAALGATGDLAILEGRKGLAEAFGGKRCNAGRVAQLLGKFERLGAAKGDLTSPSRHRPAYIKQWPCCAYSHGALTAFFELVEKLGDRRQEIESLEIVLPFDPKSSGIFRSYDVPKTGVEGKFCLPFIMASAWRDGAVGVQTFREPAFSRPILSELMRKVLISVDGARRAEEGGAFRTTLNAKLRNEGSLSVDVIGRQFELDKSGTTEKFERNLRQGMVDISHNLLLEDAAELDRLQVREVLSQLRRSQDAG